MLASVYCNYQNPSFLDCFGCLFVCLYPTNTGFSLAWFLAFTMSFASLVSHVVSLFYNYATGELRERLRKR